MARVTRSKKVGIAEDNTAQTLRFETASLPHTGLQIQPFSGVAGNTMAKPGEEFSVDAEIKGLKATYKRLTGTVRDQGKKGKSNQRANGQQESEEGHVVEKNDALSRTIPDRQEGCEDDNGSTSVAQSTEQSKSTLKKELAEQIAQPVTRTTRRQAKAKEGPCEDFSEDLLPGQNDVPDFRQLETIDLLVSLCAGCPAGLSRSITTSAFGRSAEESERTYANVYSLAEELLRKSKREAGQKETTVALLPGGNSVMSQEDSQKSEQNLKSNIAAKKRNVDDPASEKFVLFQAEPKVFAENAKSHRDPAKLATEPSNPQADNGDEDSFVEQISCRSPAKPVSRIRDALECTHRPPQSPERPTTDLINGKDTIQADDADAFVEQTSSRSPAKPVSRIEDSVEALDHLEEVEEALHEAAMAERMVSPEKTRQKPKEQPAKLSDPVISRNNRGQTATKQQPGKPGYASMRVKATAMKQTSVIKKAISMTFKPSDSSETSSIREVDRSLPLPKKTFVKRPISLLPSKEPAKSTKALTRPTNFELPGEAVTRKLKEQREARLLQRNESSEDSSHTARQYSRPSVKSTKPLTKPAFELPGEALSRKKREAYDAKLKAQEEDERKRREFKAKPVRKSMTTTIRDTVASRARQSKVGLEGIADGTLSVSKRNLNVGARRLSILELHAMANTSAPRAPASAAPLERKPSTKFHGPSMSGLAMQRTVSVSDVHVQRQRAKEIYNRDQKLAEDIERERLEREAAAKRAREEAAERGRQASREWAAKQLVRKMAEGDKGMCAGYGPGGQMGLKASA